MDCRFFAALEKMRMSCGLATCHSRTRYSLSIYSVSRHIPLLQHHYLPHIFLAKPLRVNCWKSSVINLQDNFINFMLTMKRNTYNIIIFQWQTSDSKMKNWSVIKRQTDVVLVHACTWRERKRETQYKHQGRNNGSTYTSEYVLR